MAIGYSAQQLNHDNRNPTNHDKWKCSFKLSLPWRFTLGNCNFRIVILIEYIFRRQHVLLTQCLKAKVSDIYNVTVMTSPWLSRLWKWVRRCSSTVYVMTVCCYGVRWPLVLPPPPAALCWQILPWRQKRTKTTTPADSNPRSLQTGITKRVCL